jgi:hypothetical protein
MAKKDEAVVEVKADTSQLDQAFEKAENAVKDLGKAGEESIGLLDSATGGFASRLVKARAGITEVIKGLSLTKVALISTGLGAFVVVLGSLIAYFTQTKRGSELLAQGMAALKGVFGVLTDTVSKLGEMIVNAFRSPKQAITDFANTLKQYVTDKINGILDSFGLLGDAIKKLFAGDVSGALESGGKAAQKFIENATPMGDIVKVAGALADGFGDVASAAADAAAKAAELEKAQQRLADLQRETLVETAKERAAIKELNLIAEDTTKGINERIRAAERAGAKERELFNRRKKEADEALRIRREQNALSESTAEDLQAEAELEAEVYNLQAESLELQTTLQNKLNALRAEGIRKAEEEKKAIEDAIAAYREANKLSGIKPIGEIAQIENEGLRQALEARGIIIQEAVKTQEQIEADAAARRKQMFQDNTEFYAGEVTKFIKDTGEMVTMGLQVADALGTLFQKNEEKRARQTFQIQKALSITSAIMSTAEGVTAALTDKTQPSTVARIIQAVAVGVMGAAQVASIARQQFKPSGGASAPSAPAMAAAPAPGFFPPANNETSGFRAYVVGSEVSNQMQASQRLKERVALFN